jgi:CheY-like chemotaxis protein
LEKKYQILLVDDSKETLEGLNQYLSRNYNIRTAKNGLDALKVFEHHKKELDLVITDIVMPDISGAALISMIKAKSPDTPIIAMTGWGQLPSELAFEAKADVVLKKPFDLEDLDRSLSMLLAGPR